MKYLQIGNLALLALGVTLTVVLAVECLLYLPYVHSDPIAGQQLPMVMRFTVVFAILTTASALAYWGHRGRRMWRWPAQLLPPLAVIVVLVTLAQLRN